MGRPSLVPQRTSELLDAVDRVILRDGVAAATIAAVAREAGVQTSLVHHYLGTRDQVLDAAVDRILRRIEALLLSTLTDVPDTGRLDAQLDVLFSPALDNPLIEQMVEHLVVASYTDARVRDRLTAMYQRFADIVVVSLRSAHPDISAAQGRAVSHAVVALAHASPTLAWLRLDSDVNQSLRAAAGKLVAPPADGYAALEPAPVLGNGRAARASQ